MDLPAKLQLMEALWDDLSRLPDQLESPEWHKEVLDERRGRLAAGEERILDWETAKAEIRRRIS